MSGLGLALTPALAGRPAVRRRSRVRAVTVASGADFTPDQLQGGLQRQLADSAACQPFRLHRNWVAGMSSAQARHKSAAGARQGWAFPAPSVEFDPDQLRRGLERQLAHSTLSRDAQQAPIGAGVMGPEIEEDMKCRQRAARRWIQPWLEQQARKRSVQAQAQLRQRMELMSAKVEAAALQRQLLSAGCGDAPRPAAAPALRRRGRVCGRAASGGAGASLEDLEASRRSLDVQAQLRQRVVMMSAQQEGAALRRQLLLGGSASMGGQGSPAEGPATTKRVLALVSNVVPADGMGFPNSNTHPNAIPLATQHAAA